MHKNQKKGVEKVALERINQLFEFAERLISDRKFDLIPDYKKQMYLDRYVSLARNISMKANVPIPKEYKRRFCKHCHTYLRPGINSRTRTRDGRLVSFCMNCKRFTRQVLENEDGKEEKREKPEG